jgi:hypothetical protein
MAHRTIGMIAPIAIAMGSLRPMALPCEVYRYAGDTTDRSQFIDS